MKAGVEALPDDVEALKAALIVARAEAAAARAQQSDDQALIAHLKLQIEKLNREDALAFYRRFYAPNNATLVIAGDVDRGAAEEMQNADAFGPALPARLDETFHVGLTPGGHHPSIRMPDGTETFPIAGIAVHRPVLDELAHQHPFTERAHVSGLTCAQTTFQPVSVRIQV